MPTRIDRLTRTQQTRFDEWADQWIEIGLRTEPADRARFEAAAKDCYRYAEIPWPGRVIWIPSPLVGAFAAPIALQLLKGELGIVHGAVHEVGEALREAVHEAVEEAVHEVGEAVREAVHEAVHEAVGEAVHGAVEGAVRRGWYQYLGGQFWVGGWGWSGAWTSFLRDVCDLELPGDLWGRGRAYEATMESACWWWPTTDFVMVSERPHAIRRELVDSAQPRGRGSHRLHCETGPAVEWDGWGVYAIHGVRVPERVITAPETYTGREWAELPNQEVRRVVAERKGWQPLLDDLGASLVDTDLDLLGEPRELWHANVSGWDEPLRMVAVTNSTPEPDGSKKRYWLRVPPDANTCQQAVAWTFDVPEADYAPLVET